MTEGEALPAGTRLAFAAEAAFSPAAIRALSAGPGVRQLGVRRGTPLFDFVQPMSGAPADTDLPLPIVAGELKGTAGEWAGELASVCDEAEHVAIRTVPYGKPPHQLRVPAGERIAGVYRHWLHVLNLNQAFLERALQDRGARGRVVKLGKAQVHRTALVEGSILADDVEVDCDASVIDSYVGEGARIGDHACLVRCVVGAHCHTLIDTHLRRVVAFSGSTLSNLGSEDLLLGHDVFITTGVAFFSGVPGVDARIDGQDVRRSVLGGAVGDRAVLGARSLFGASLAVPAETTVVMKPGEGLVRLDDESLARAGARLGDPATDY